MNGSPFEIKDFETFFENICQFKAKRDDKIRSGINDYNLMTSLLRQNDEVRLHSRFIYSLINPDGKHYQNSFFLKSFLDVLDIKEFDCENATVKRESENIDLYITDGCKHIIIENKIHAYDQDRQISRYIKLIKSNTVEDDVFDKIYVIYLTLNARAPSKASLDEWHIEGNYLKNDTNSISYKNITYKTDVLSWISKILVDTNVIPENIYHSIKSYQEVIERLTRAKGSNLMTIEEYLLKDDNILNLKISGEISKKFDLMKGKVLFKFFNNIKDSISNNTGDGSLKISSADQVKILKDFVYSGDRCTKWFMTGKAKEHYIGTYFCFNDNIQFGVMVAQANLHIVVICDETIYNNLISYDKYFKDNYTKRDWKKGNKSFQYYSKDTKHNIHRNINNSDVLELLSCRSNKEYIEIIKDIFVVAGIIEKFVDSTNSN